MKPWISQVPRYLALTALIYVPVFGYLDTLPIHMWDEARIAVNAYEMYRGGDFIVVHYKGFPEMWNTKPPLLIWTQVLFMKLIGPGELAIRLPSALAVFGTCVALMVFSIRYLRSFWFGFIAVIALITSEGFVHTHISRTGDFDAMLTLFTTLSTLFLFCHVETNKNKFVYLFFMALTLGALTKGIAALMFAPAWLIFLLISKKTAALLRNPHFYTGLIIFLVTVLGYYLIRESRNPGYIAAVQENELGGRFLTSQGDQKQDIWYYYDKFVTERLADRYFLIPCGMLIGLMWPARRFNRLALCITLATLIFFGVISFAKTRLEWYDAPLYPLISVLLAFFVYFIFVWLRESAWLRENLRQNVAPWIFLFLVLYFPYRQKFKMVYFDTEHQDEKFFETGYYLKAALSGKKDLNGKFLVYDGYNTQNEFYLMILQDRGVKTGWKDGSEIRPGDDIIACHGSVKETIRNKFTFTEEKQNGQVSVFHIIAERDTIR